MIWRRIRTCALVLTLAICLATLVLWPLSFFRILAVHHFGQRRIEMCTVSGGQLMLQQQTGSIVEENLRAYPEFRTRSWFFESARNREHYFDYRESWRDTIRFQNGVNSSNYVYKGNPQSLTNRWVMIPLWCALWLSALGPAIVLRGYLRRRGRLRRGECTVCGYDLRATPGRCPECGRQPGTRQTTSNVNP